VNDLPNHGTGWLESEMLLDVVTLFADWDGNLPPDFTIAQRRLREKFTLDELRNFEVTMLALRGLVSAEIEVKRFAEHSDENDENGSSVKL
jgi:hypothetical protein